MFEHCSLCFRVRMAAALKRLHLQETVVLDDDTDTMVGLVGKRVIPILVKDDGQPMHMVTHVDSIGDPVLIGPERGEIAAWSESILQKLARLQCRAILYSACRSLRPSPHSTITNCASIARSEISASCAPTRAPTSRSLCPILNSLTA
jgi:hypothetical protein